MKNIFKFKNKALRSNGFHVPNGTLNDRKRLMRTPLNDKAYGSEELKACISQRGRSMVEMLGVLAVIGVLSIGGVAGYRMAMERMQLNKIRRLISTVAVAISAEQMGNNPNSFVNDSNLTSLERSELFCDAYAPEFCEKRYSSTTYQLVPLFSGSHVTDNAPTSTSHVSWNISRNNQAPSRCYCESDMNLNLQNITSGVCAMLVDEIINNYADVVSGFSGYDHAAIDLEPSKIKKIVCYNSGTIKDEKTMVWFSVIFSGKSSSDVCGACHAISCPCE